VVRRYDERLKAVVSGIGLFSHAYVSFDIFVVPEMTWPVPKLPGGAEV